jgi:hypothetical protein
MLVKILKKILTNTSVIAGIITFLLIFFIGLYLEFQAGEALFASLVLALIAMATAWWERWGF